MGTADGPSQRVPRATKRAVGTGAGSGAQQGMAAGAPAESEPYPDQESRAHDDHHESLRLWLRMLTCTALIEAEVRARLRRDFAITLPRFDLLAQLERHAQGLKMGELSRRMMVTGGNVTGITDQLAAEGLVRRTALPDDRRAYLVKLTPAGKRAFDRMAAAHEAWVIELLSGISAKDREQLTRLLGKLKKQVNGAPAPGRETGRTRPQPDRAAPIARGDPGRTR